MYFLLSVKSLMLLLDHYGLYEDRLKKQWEIVIIFHFFIFYVFVTT